MSRFIELSAVEESGSGVLFPMLLDANDITAVMSVEGQHLIDLPAANTVITIRGASSLLYTTARYADLRDTLQGESK